MTDSDQAQSNSIKVVSIEGEIVQLQISLDNQDPFNVRLASGQGFHFSTGSE